MNNPKLATPTRYTWEKEGASPHSKQSCVLKKLSHRKALVFLDFLTSTQHSHRTPFMDCALTTHVSFSHCISHH